jgi:hypothetical protein
MAKDYQDVFISYGRVDSKAFVSLIHQHLIAQNLKVWLDQNDIPPAVDFQNQIDNAIEKSDSFIFVISPHSVNSPYCYKEIELATKYNKRIVPLLHVEEISHDVWQKRNPVGTDSQWEEYKAKGLYSCFPNMYPVIAKINWVFFREEADNFATSFAKLLNLLKQQKNYVRQHTTLLTKAIAWEQHQKQSHYLLIGEELEQAKEWLRVRFKEEQPPCTPTDLHCEFITESRKNANNLMTQVFTAYSEEDKAIAEQICSCLMREGLTIWNKTTDVQTGTVYEEAVKQGIEGADNFICLVSPALLQSKSCQKEIDYALFLQKRIIPVLIGNTDLSKIPNNLGSLFHIDLINKTLTSENQQNMRWLLRILQQDESYHEEHKILLTKALKWERQNHNPSMLLQGYNLRHAEMWLKVAEKKTQYLPTLLQREFIADSARQLPGQSLDIFLSYSRIDSGFARQLNEALQIQGKRTWFDQESIASGTDFQQEIYRGIENTDNFLFVLSPTSISSPHCAAEVEYAVKLNKRIVTVLHREINLECLHPELAKVQWIDFDQKNGSFSTSLKDLLQVLNTDTEYLRTHTRLLIRAIEWNNKKRDNSYLLRGTDLREATVWLTTSFGREPQSTDLQAFYVKASFEEEDKKLEEEDKKLKTQQRTRRNILLLHHLTTIVLTFGGFYWLYQSATNNAVAAISDDLTSTVIAAASQVDGDTFLSLYQEGKSREDGYSDDPRYWQHVEWLATIESIEPRAFIYTYAAAPKPGAIVFIGSGSAINHRIDGAKFLEYYDIEVEEGSTKGSLLYQGLSEQIISTEPFIDPWGTWISGVVPITNSQGEKVGALGVDFRSDEVSKVQQAIRRASFKVLIFGIVYILASSLIALRIFKLSLYRKSL